MQFERACCSSYCAPNPCGQGYFPFYTMISAFSRCLPARQKVPVYTRCLYALQTSLEHLGRGDKPEATLTECFSYFLLQAHGIPLRTIHGNSRVFSAARVKGSGYRICSTSFESPDVSSINDSQSRNALKVLYRLNKVQSLMQCYLLYFAKKSY